MGWKFRKQEGAGTQDGTGVQDGARVQDGPRVHDSVPGAGFVLTIEDVFSITGRGTVVTAGTITVGDQVRITPRRHHHVTTPLPPTEASGTAVKVEGMTAWAELGDRCWVRRYPEWDLNVGIVVGSEGALVIDTR